MGLLSECTEANRIIHQPRSVTYSRRMIFGLWTYGSGAGIAWYTKAYELHRYCTASYSYVGLSKTAATDAVTKLVEMYTRAMYYSDWDETTGVFADKACGKMPMAEVVARTQNGHMWQVDVTIREDDSRLALSELTDPSAYFTLENARGYEI